MQGDHARVVPQRATAWRGPRTPVFVFGFLAMLGLGHSAGCARDERIAVPADSTPPELYLHQPEEGAEVADTLHVWAESSRSEDIARVVLLVDGLGRGVRYAPPWRFAWPCSSIAHHDRHSIVLEAIDAAGNFFSTSPRRVTIHPNQPPQVWIRFPFDGLWIASDSQTGRRPWQAGARDPDEDGAPDKGQSHDTWSADELRDESRIEERLIWTLNGDDLPNVGAEIPAPPLPLGMSEVALRVADRWGRSAVVSHRICLFSYPATSSPQGVCEALFAAWRARDSEKVMALCAPDMILVPPDAPSGEVLWPRSRFAAAISDWLGDSTMVRLEVTPAAGSIEELMLAETSWAKAEISNLTLEIERIRHAQADRPPRTETTRIRTGTRIFLRREQENGSWQIVAWWDLHASPWLAAQGPSLSEFLGARVR